ncbi:MAG: enolase C-terminal domain-like protein [Caldilineaceae bacterium]
MKIDALTLSIFALPGNTATFDLLETEEGAYRRWTPTRQQRTQEEVHVLHVRTDDGVEGVCTVGDARYTTMRKEELAQLRILTLGADPLDRERLNAKLNAATRTMFSRPGWFGAFDNCLWDIAGKVAGLPVAALMGRARPSCPAYYNFGGATLDALVADAQAAVAQGFPAVKDHFRGRATENIAGFHAIRAGVGDQIDLLHDAALSHYTWTEAVRIGRALEELGYLWFEEPLADREQAQLQQLCAALEIPILAPETLMHDLHLSAQWLMSGATDWLRANARHGTTATLKLAHLAELHGQRIELNGPGGLFGLVHAHLVCAIQNTSYYEYFPGGSRDERGKEIGLLNPPLPVQGRITPPIGPGWGAEWDWDYFVKTRVGVW